MSLDHGHWGLGGRPKSEGRMEQENGGRTTKPDYHRLGEGHEEVDVLEAGNGFTQ